jgi:hypothetical protein
MDAFPVHPGLAVSHAQALRFFFEHLRDVCADGDAPDAELLYNASVLAHFATTSAASRDFPNAPVSLTSVFDVFVLDRSQHVDPQIMEAAAAQCLLLTGFFCGQQRQRHNVEWYAALGASFYGRAADQGSDSARVAMMRTMAVRFAVWRRRQARLARELRESSLLLQPRPAA